MIDAGIAQLAGETTNPSTETRGNRGRCASGPRCNDLVAGGEVDVERARAFAERGAFEREQLVERETERHTERVEEAAPGGAGGAVQAEEPSLAGPRSLRLAAGREDQLERRREVRPR